MHGSCVSRFPGYAAMFLCCGRIQIGGAVAAVRVAAGGLPPCRMFLHGSIFVGISIINMALQADMM
jgi:hypothetical protein